MATSAEHIDRRRPIDRFLGNYSEDHRNATNRLIHWICVPLIVWTVVAALWVIPVPTFARPGLWAGLSRPLGAAMLVFFLLLMALTWWLHQQLGSRVLLWSAVGVFVLAWVAQFIGHEFEGKRPSFLTDLVYLLIGPLWLMSKLFRRLGLHW
jgi:uncharacterized membrane protein YGL010W